MRLRAVMATALAFGLIALLAIARSDAPEDGGALSPAEQIAAAEALAEQQAAEEQETSELENPPADGEVAVVGAKAPDFRVIGEDSVVRLSDYRGSPVVVEFIATWCPHCQQMAPRFAAVMEANPQVAYLTVGVAGEPLEKVLEWHDELLATPMPGKAAADTKGEARRAYAVQGTPTTAFITASGELEDLIAGELSEQELAERVGDLND